MELDTSRCEEENSTLILRRSMHRTDRGDPSASSGTGVILESHEQAPTAQSGPLCSFCKSDRQKCVWMGNDAKCTRCRENGYPCLDKNAESETDNKRRKLSRMKCEFCRQSKQKCLPLDRQWPGIKCERCISKGLLCSKPQTSAEARATPEAGKLSTAQASHLSTISKEPSNLSFEPARIGRRLVPPARLRARPGTPRLAEIISKTVNTFKYSRLTAGEDFRLLGVLPSQHSERLVCKLYPSSLAPGRGSPFRNYEALSYCWGDEEPNHPISILSFHRGFGEKYPVSNLREATLWVRPNLYAALCKLRSPTDEIFLWVDAVCINQEDPEEKSRQVSIMHQIYFNADNVCVWLGPENPLAPDAAGIYGLMRAMLDFEQLDQLALASQNAGHWQAFINLMRNRWFSRNWTLQEISVARHATVHYGNEKIHWDDFRSAIVLFELKKDRIRELLRVSKQVLVEADSYLGIQMTPACFLINTERSLLRISPDGEIQEKLIDLETLVSSTLLDFSTTEPRDTIYAVLSMAKDSRSETLNTATSKIQESRLLIDSRIAPRYDRSLDQVFIGFVDYCIETSESLDIICRPWASYENRNRKMKVDQPQRNEVWKIPSWILPVSKSPFGKPNTALSGRLNGDSFVGKRNIQSLENYNASAGLKPNYSIPTSMSPGQTNEYDGKLIVNGFIVDRIQQLSPRLIGVIPQECLELAGWHMEEPEKVPVELWRTLVADRDMDGRSTPSWFARACKQCLQRVTLNGDLVLSTLISSPTTPSVLTLFLKRVAAVTWNRKLIKTKGSAVKNGQPLLGLGPTDSHEGDVVAILFGCSVPVVLRPQNKGDEEYYQFIGEAFVYGIMDGEAVIGRNYAYPYETAERFEIR